MVVIILEIFKVEDYFFGEIELEENFFCAAWQIRFDSPTRAASSGGLEPTRENGKFSNTSITAISGAKLLRGSFIDR